MSELINKDSRQLIPRWHTSRKLKLIQNLDPINMEQVEDGSLFEIEKKEQRWIEKPSISSATELFVGLKLANLVSSELHGNVKKFILSHFDDLSASIKNLVSPELKRLDSSSSYTTDPNLIIKIIGALKSIVREIPHDSLSWNDLAFYYTSIGQIEKAQYCLNIANCLNPDHPFLARSYSRFLVHIGEPEKAIHILRKTNRLKTSPEILSADIAIREEFSIGNPKISIGKRLIESFNDRPSLISELASSIGTIEVKNGAIKKGKKLLAKAVIAPTENTVAQLMWLSHRHNVDIPIDSSKYFSLEANANSQFYSKEFAASRDNLMRMHDFQPFSEKALIDAGYISLVHLKDTDFVLKHLGSFNGLPLREFLANNNFLVARMLSGDFRDIDKSFSKQKQLAYSSKKYRSNNIAVYKATLGMYLYRQGLVDDARNLYSETEGYFKAQGMSRNVAVALLHQGIEEKRLDVNKGRKYFRRAKAEAKKSAAGLVLLDRIEDELNTE